MKYIEIKTTFKNLQEAENMAKLFLDEKLVACAQINEIRSIYNWNGELEDTKEYLLNLKTKDKNYLKIEEVIKDNHSYELPQIIATPIDLGSKKYLAWMDSLIKPV